MAILFSAKNFLDHFDQGSMKIINQSIPRDLVDDWIRKSPEELSRTLALRVSSINVFLKFATDNGYNAALLQNTKKSSSNYIP